MKARLWQLCIVQCGEILSPAFSQALKVINSSIGLLSEGLKVRKN